MALHICASFGRDWDGTYVQVDVDNYAKVPNQDYWIYHDSWFWYISDSAYKYDDERSVAKKPFTPLVVEPAGNYVGVNDEPDGIVRKGECP